MLVFLHKHPLFSSRVNIQRKYRHTLDLSLVGETFPLLPIKYRIMGRSACAAESEQTCRESSEDS